MIGPSGALKAMVLSREAKNARLRQIIKELQRHRFGHRAEPPPEDQLLLGLEEAEQVRRTVWRRRTPGTGRQTADKPRAPPAHLPRVDMLIDIESYDYPCCGNGLHRIGEDASKKLDIVPAQFRVLVTRRPKHACRACEEVIVQVAAPARLIEGGISTEATVAQVWSPNTPITCLSTDKHKSTSARGRSRPLDS